MSILAVDVNPFGKCQINRETSVYTYYLNMEKISPSIRLTVLLLLVACSAHGQLFVANRGNGIIGEYRSDGTAISNALITISDSRFFPAGMVVSGTNIYACGVGSNTIEFFHTDGTSLGSFAIPGSPFLGIAVSGSEFYVGSQLDGYIYKYDITPGGLSLNASEFPIDTGGYPEGLAIVGTNIYMADYANNAVQLFSTAGSTVPRKTLITGLHQPFGLLVTGTNLYVANAGNGTVGWYTTSGQTNNAAMITGLSTPMGLATDGTNLFVSNYGDVTVGSYTLTGATNNVALISGLSSPAGLAWLSSSTASPIPLNISRSGPNVILSWSASGAAFRLRQNPNLNTAGWTAVTNVPAVNGGNNQVTLPATNNMFFDLINP